MRLASFYRDLVLKIVEETVERIRFLFLFDRDPGAGGRRKAKFAP
jgi:hypothetical protein